MGHPEHIEYLCGCRFDQWSAPVIICFDHKERPDLPYVGLVSPKAQEPLPPDGVEMSQGFPYEELPPPGDGYPGVSVGKPEIRARCAKHSVALVEVKRGPNKGALVCPQCLKAQKEW